MSLKAEVPLILAGTFLLCVSTIGAENTLEPDLPINEVFVETVPVSGSRDIKGVVGGKLDGSAILEDLRVCLPARNSGKLMLEIGSIDGRYTATVSYSVSGKAPGAYRLSFAPREDAAIFLKSKSRREVALLAYVKDGSSTDLVLPVFWEERAATPAPLLIQVQSRAAETWISWQGQRRIEEGACRSVMRPGNSAANAVAFNHFCDLPALDESALRSAVLMRYNLNRYRNAGIPIVGCP